MRDSSSQGQGPQPFTIDNTSATPKPPKKPDFWRIRGIKVEERDVAIQWLREQVGDLARQSEGQGFSLAPDGPSTLCATLTTYTRPTPIIRGWRVDKDFIGFTPLNEAENAGVDIVAVTGLGGHALGSFRSKDGVSVWLRDFAPQGIARARFITYGYASQVAQSKQSQSVKDLAQMLLVRLDLFRRLTQTQHRPLIFICHSLGGVVLKEALVMSNKATEPQYKNLHEVENKTYGLLFMGVPNLGLRHPQLLTVVDGAPNQGFINDLVTRSDSEASQFLSYLTGEFSDLDRRRGRPFEIISYFETQTTPTLENDGDGNFAATGPDELMVTRTSAAQIGSLVRTINHLPSDTNHRDLVRFEHPHDERYMPVIDQLRRMADEAAEAASRAEQSRGERSQRQPRYNSKHRVNPHHAPSRPNSYESSISARTQRSLVLSNARHCSEGLINTITSSARWNTAAFVREHHEMLRHDYRFLPEEACHWLLTEPATKRWLNASLGPSSTLQPVDERFLAICGGRGTGKFLATSYITRHLVNKKKRAVVLNFCKLSWQTSQLTPQLILRCIISELLSKKPEVFFKRIMTRNGPMRYHEWFMSVNVNDTAELLDVLRELLSCDQIGPVFLVIDGMDTCKNRASFVRSLVDLTRRLPIAVAVSDQRDAEVARLYQYTLGIDVRVGQIDCDIEVYVRSQLEKHFPERKADHQRIINGFVAASERGLGWVRHVISLMGNAKDDTEFDEALSKVVDLRNLVIGRALDVLRASQACAHTRQQLLLKLILRALVCFGCAVKLYNVETRVKHECERYRQIRLALGDSHANFNFSSDAIECAVRLLAQTEPPLVTISPENKVGFASDIVADFFARDSPLTLPQVPPLWVQTDDCYIFRCHMGSSGDALELRKCQHHQELIYEDWHATEELLTASR